MSTRLNATSTVPAIPEDANVRQARRGDVDRDAAERAEREHDALPEPRVREDARQARAIVRERATEQRAHDGGEDEEADREPRRALVRRGLLGRRRRRRPPPRGRSRRARWKRRKRMFSATSAFRPIASDASVACSRAPRAHRGGPAETRTEEQHTAERERHPEPHAHGIRDDDGAPTNRPAGDESGFANAKMVTRTPDQRDRDEDRAREATLGAARHEEAPATKRARDANR